MDKFLLALTLCVISLAINHTDAFAKEKKSPRDSALGRIMAGDTGAQNSKMAAAMNGKGGDLEFGVGPAHHPNHDRDNHIHGLGVIDTGGGTGRQSGPDSEIKVPKSLPKAPALDPREWTADKAAEIKVHWRDNGLQWNAYVASCRAYHTAKFRDKGDSQFIAESQAERKCPEIRELGIGPVVYRNDMQYLCDRGDSSRCTPWDMGEGEDRFLQRWWRRIEHEVVVLARRGTHPDRIDARVQELKQLKASALWKFRVARDAREEKKRAHRDRRLENDG